MIRAPMGSLLPLLLAVIIEALAEEGFTLGVEAPWAMPLAGSIPYLIGAAARRAALRGRFARSERWVALVRLSGALAFGVAALALGWVTSVERWTGTSLGALAWPEPALLAALAPFLVFQCLALHAEVAAHVPPGPTRRRVLGFQLRGFLLMLVPIGLYLALAWAVGTNEVARAWLSHVGLAQGLFAMVVIAAVAATLPYVLRRVWDTTPVPDGPARRLLEHVASRARFRASEWLVWRTGGSLANAAVVGFLPFGRLVLFTDQLLSQLGPRELVAVVGHEIGHTMRRHVWILLAWAMSFVLAADLALGVLLPRLPGLGDEDAALAVGLALAVVFLGLGAAAFGWLSRRLELDADLYCAELTGDGVALVSALRQVDGNWERGGWRHFSSARRVEFLAEALTSPALVRRFKQFILAAGIGGALAASATIAAEVYTLVERLPLERIDAALALGRYDEARAAIDELPSDAVGPSERTRLRAQVDVAEELGRDAGVVEAVASLESALLAVQAAWGDAGDAAAQVEDQSLQRALALADLAQWLGRGDLGSLARAMQAALAGEADLVREALGALEPPTRDALSAPLLRAAGRHAEVVPQ